MIFISGAGNYVRDDVIFNTIQLVSDSPDLHPYVVHEAWKAMRDTENCTEKQPLTQVSSWCIGEYGAGLLNGVSVEGETLTVSEQEVIEVYQKILWAKHMSLITKQYAIMSVTKLSTRFPNATPKIQEIIDAYACHMEIDLQQRGVEFSALFKNHSSMKAALLEPMPPMERDVTSNGVTPNADLFNGVETSGQTESLLGGNDLAGISIIGTSGQTGNSGGGDSLLDLIDSSVPTIQPQNGTKDGGGGGQNSLLDLLGDLDMSSTASAPPAAGNILDGLTPNNPILQSPSGGPLQTPTSAGGNINSLDDLLNNVNHEKQIPSIVGHNKNDINITFHFDPPSPSGLLVMNLNIVNEGSSPVSEFYLQAAVPKSMQLEILAASNTVIEAKQSIKQVLKVNNPNKAILKMRLKVAFNRGGQAVLDQSQVENFPPEVLNH